MKTTHPQSLLDVIDVLTTSTFEHVAQLHDGKWVLRSVEVPPLLELMRDAVSPSGNRDTGSASMKSTRSVVDFEALFEYAKMTSTAAGWAHSAGVRPTRDAATDLRAWHSATLADNARDDDWFRRHLIGWTVVIRNHLQPPERFVIRRACPVCRSSAFGDAINGGDQWPIEVRYRLDDDGHTSGHTATCRIRACGTRWLGYEAVMELAEELAEATPRPHDSGSEER